MNVPLTGLETNKSLKQTPDLGYDKIKFPVWNVYPGRGLSTTREDEKHVRDNPQYQQGTFRVRPGYLQELCHFAISDGQRRNSYICYGLCLSSCEAFRCHYTFIHCVNECCIPGVNDGSTTFSSGRALESCGIRDRDRGPLRPPLSSPSAADLSDRRSQPSARRRGPSGEMSG